MSRPRITLMAMLLVLPLLLALTMIGRTTVVMIFFSADGDPIESSFAVGNDNGDETVYYGCVLPVAGPCRPLCANCHSNGQDRSKEVFTAAKHRLTYFPQAAMRLAENQRVALGQGGSYLTTRNGRFEYALRDGTALLSAPPGSLLLKATNGSPIGLYMPTEPKMHAKPR